MPNWSDLAAVFSPDSPIRKAEEAQPTAVASPVPEAHAPPPDLTVPEPVPETVPEAVVPPATGAHDASAIDDSPAPALAGQGDHYAEFGAHVGRVLSAAHEACEEMRREARAELEVRIAAVDAELLRRQHELDERERALDERVQAAEDHAAAVAAKATEEAAEAERLSAAVRADAEERLASLLLVQDTLRERLDSASGELRQTLASLSTGDD